MKNKLKVLSLFSGIGAFEKALEREGIDYELVNYCEVDKYAAESYSAIHNVSTALNLGDITQIDIEGYNKIIDLMTHGSPCTDYSISGKGAGGDKGSNTRSSLMWYSVEFAKKTNPKYVVWENVDNVLISKHKHNVEKYLSELDMLGYTNHIKVFNSSYFGVPHERNRIYIVSIRNDVHNQFEFEEVHNQTNKTLEDILEPLHNSKYDIDAQHIDNFRNFLEYETISNEKIQKVNCVGSIFYENKYKSQAGRVYDLNGYCPSLTTMEGGYRQPCIIYNQNDNKPEEYKCRRLSPLECWRLMGFDDEDFYKAKERLMNTYYKGKDRADSQLYKQAGNSIVVNVLQSIFSKLTT